MFGLLDLRIVGILVIIIVGMGYALGILSWDDNKYKCMEGKYWDRSRPVTVFEIGRQKFNAFPWDCPEIMRYDPKQLKKTHTIPDITNAQ